MGLERGGRRLRVIFQTVAQYHHGAERCRCNGTSGPCPSRCWPSDEAAVHADPSRASQDRPPLRRWLSLPVSPCRQAKVKKQSDELVLTANLVGRFSLVIPNQSLACTLHDVASESASGLQPGQWTPGSRGRQESRSYDFGN